MLTSSVVGIHFQKDEDLTSVVLLQLQIQNRHQTTDKAPSADELRDLKALMMMY